jgi:hypothetical protein
VLPRHITLPQRSYFGNMMHAGISKQLLAWNKKDKTKPNDDVIMTHSHIFSRGQPLTIMYLCKLPRYKSKCKTSQKKANRNTGKPDGHYGRQEVEVEASLGLRYSCSNLRSAVTTS